MDKNPKESVLQACRMLLRPIVRLLMRSGVTWKDFAELSKAAFVQVATDEFGIRGRPTNASRVAILSGLSRREVAKQRQRIEAEPARDGSGFLNPAQRLLSGWHQDPLYCVDGVPLEIARDGPAPSFADLCQRYAGDIPGTALLKELRKVGAVADGPGGGLRVLQRVYFPAQFDAAKVLRAGSVMQDLGDTVVFDLLAAQGTPLRFERRAENDRIDARYLPEFRDYLAREGQAFLERVDAWLSAHEADRSAPASRCLRLGVGVYHIQTEPERGSRR
ncbi:MAG: DUF6502 family protein [Steroidobacteraceae bacterium]|nr:DUF6502 family protein [Steroidobacteraceae bacterium]MDW8259161.1 DUF6502 family protein [Gammaproteobacteria bacterium]